MRLEIAGSTRYHPAELAVNPSTCSYTNFKAIAKANLDMYLRSEGEESEARMQYLNTWQEAEDLAIQYVKKSFDAGIHKWWLDSHTSPKDLWKKVDWKGKNIEQKQPELSTVTVNKYFDNIFN